MTNTSAKPLKKNNSYNCTRLHIKDLINQRHTHLPLYKNSLHKTCMSLLQLYYGGFFFCFCTVFNRQSLPVNYNSTGILLFDVETHSADLNIRSVPHNTSGVQTRTKIECIKIPKNMLVMLHILVPTQTTLKLNSLDTRQVGVMTTLIAEFYL